MGFDFAIVYKKCVDNVIVDALSRMHNPAELLSIIDSSTITTDLYNRIVDSWEHDQAMKALISKLQSSSNHQGHYTWRSQQLRRKWKLMTKMRKEVKQFVRDCEICQRYKPNLEAYPGVWNATLVYEKPPPVHIPYVRRESKVDLVDKTLSEKEAVVDTLKFHISRAQSRMKSHADKVIQRIGQVAYKLKLPHDYRIHNVFHVSQLKKCRHPSPNQICRNLPPFDNNGVFLMKPVAILDRRMARKGNGVEVYVLVQWANGTNEDATWESMTDLQAKFSNFDCTV
uniref:Uncharacterized protein n=1 Tax=Tanacetum cinerariifolium TaxID=118510 RepID=A0A6L2NW02_TANCI|nr:hypothetical protein [Tanacetum cinerariifolium]